MLLRNPLPTDLRRAVTKIITSWWARRLDLAGLSHQAIEIWRSGKSIVLHGEQPTLDELQDVSVALEAIFDRPEKELALSDSRFLYVLHELRELLKISRHKNALDVWLAFSALALGPSTAEGLIRSWETFADEPEAYYWRRALIPSRLLTPAQRGDEYPRELYVPFTPAVISLYVYGGIGAVRGTLVVTGITIDQPYRNSVAIYALPSRQINQMMEATLAATHYRDLLRKGQSLRYEEFYGGRAMGTHRVGTYWYPDGVGPLSFRWDSNAVIPVKLP